MVTVRRRIYDPERQKVLLELVVEIFGGGTDGTSGSCAVVLREAGGLPAIARRLVARFALPVDPKDLAENLADQVAAAPLTVKNDGERDDEEGDAYYAFHSWLAVKGERLIKEQKLWIISVDGFQFAARLTEEAFRDFLRYACLEEERRAVLRHWRDSGRLRVNNPGHFRKRVRVAHAAGPDAFLEFYEILLAEDFPVDETLGTGGLAEEIERENPFVQAAAS
jgi:hypothetical protein